MATYVPLLLITSLVPTVLGIVSPPQPDVTDILGQMVRDIFNSYFSQEICITVLTEDNAHTFKNFPSQVPVYYLRTYIDEELELDIIDSKTSQNVSKANTIGYLILNTMNQGCLVYVIQVEHPRNLISYIAHIIRLTTVKANRKYLILPVVEDIQMQLRSNFTTQKIFQMKEMSFLPDLVVATLGIYNKKVRGCNANESIGLHQRQSKGIRMARKPTEELSSSSAIQETSGENRLLVDYPYNDVGTVESISDISKKMVALVDKDKGENVSSPNMNIQLLTHSFVGLNYSEEILLNVWVPGRGFLNASSLFPDKVLNLMGKELVVVGFDYPPYTIISQKKDPPVYSGTDFALMKEFFWRYNATFRCILSHNFWGRVWKNGSGNGILGMVVMGVADVGISGNYINYYKFKHTDISTAYYRAGVTCLVPRPRRLPSWRILMKPFSMNMWIATGVFVMVVAISLFLIAFLLDQCSGGNRSRYSSCSRSLLAAVGTLVVSPPSETGDQPTRHVHLWSALVALLVASSYSGRLASILTLPLFERPITTVNDLVTSGVVLAANHEAYLDWLTNVTDRLTQKLLRNLAVLPEEEMLREGPKGTMAFVLDRLQGGHYGLGSHLTLNTTSKLRLLAEDIYFSYGTVVLRKGSPYMEKLNTLIIQMVASGLYLQTESRMARQFMNQEEQNSVRYSTDEDAPEPTILALEHVEGAFLLLAMGLVLATVVAVMEQLWSTSTCYKRSRQRYIADIQTEDSC